MPRLTIQTKYLTLIAAVVLASSLVLSAYYYSVLRNKMITELSAKGRSMTTNLALNSEEGVLFSDTRQLSLLVSILTDDSDVVGAEVKTIDENSLVSAAADTRFLNPSQGDLAEIEQEISYESGLSLRRYRIRENDIQLLEFSAPITTRRVARDREEIGLMFDDLNGAAQNGQEIRIGSVRVILSSARLAREIQEVQQDIIYITVAVALAGILFTIPLVRSVVRPIRQLVDGTRRIAEGDLSQRVVATTRDEIGELADSFNQMAVDLEEYHEELRLHSQTLEERVRERTHELKEANEGLERANTELRKAQAQLIQAGKMAAMGEFGAGVAHELNQPLAGIKGYAQLLLSMVDEDSPLRPQLAQIDKQASRMKEITQTMWNLARQSNFEYSFIDVRQPIRDSLILINEQFRQSQIEIIADIDEELPRVYGDANQLHQVFLNLLTNAKDAIGDKETGVVKIKVASTADMRYVEVLVMDNGKGISEDIVDDVFNPFFTTKPPGKGAGLGLSINFSIIERHNGFIGVYSEEFVGAVFSVTLPTEIFAACSKNGTERRTIAPCWVATSQRPGDTRKRKPECDNCEVYRRFMAPPDSTRVARFREFMEGSSPPSS